MKRNIKGHRAPKPGTTLNKLANKIVKYMQYGSTITNSKRAYQDAYIQVVMPKIACGYNQGELKRFPQKGGKSLFETMEKLVKAKIGGDKFVS